MRKLLLILCLFFSLSAQAEQARLQVGNGLAFEVEFEHVIAYVGQINYDDYTMHLGADYVVYRNEHVTFGIGGGGTTVVHDFAAVDGYSSQEDTEVTPFVEVSARGKYWFAKVMYADTTFNAERVKCVKVKKGSCYKQETRYDSTSGPGVGYFAGFQIPFN